MSTAAQYERRKDACRPDLGLTATDVSSKAWSPAAPSRKQCIWSKQGVYVMSARHDQEGAPQVGFKGWMSISSCAVAAAVVCLGFQTAHEGRRRRDPAEAAGLLLGADEVWVKTLADDGGPVPRLLLGVRAAVRRVGVSICVESNQ